MLFAAINLKVQNVFVSRFLLMCLEAVNGRVGKGPHIIYLSRSTATFTYVHNSTKVEILYNIINY